MSGGLFDSKKMGVAMTQASSEAGSASSGVKSTKPETPVEKLLREEGVKQMNVDFCRDIAKSNLEEEQSEEKEGAEKESADPEWAGETTESPMGRTGKEETSTGKVNPRGKRHRGKTQAASDIERRSLNSFLADFPDASESEVSAFLRGFRVKLDYTLVSIQNAVSSIDGAISRLNSSVTSVDRAASDLTDLSGHATSKISTAVTGALVNINESRLIHQTDQKQEIEQSPATVADHEKEISEATASNKSVSQKILESPKESILSENTLPTDSTIGASPRPLEQKRESSSVIQKVEVTKAPKVERIPMTQHEVEVIMGSSIMSISKFYKLSEESIQKVREICQGPMSEFIKESGGKEAAKGRMKLALKPFSGK